MGVGDGTVRKSVGEFLYRPSIVTFPLSLSCFRDIAAFVLQHATFPYPTSSLPKFRISHVRLAVGGSPFGYKDVGLIDRAISFQDFQPM